MKRPHEPLKAELQGLQILCAACVVTIVLQLGFPRGDDVVIAALAGTLLGSWVAAIVMIEPRVASAVLRAGWAVRLLAEAGHRILTAACFRVHHLAEHHGWLRRGRALSSACRRSTRRVASSCLHHLPGCSWVTVRFEATARGCRAWWKSRQMRQGLAAAAHAAVTRQTIDKLYYAPAANRAHS